MVYQTKVIGSAFSLSLLREAYCIYYLNCRVEVTIEVYYRFRLDNHDRSDFKHVSLNICNFHLTSGQILRYSLVSMTLALISGPYFINLIHLTVLSLLSPGADFIKLSPGPDFIYFETGSRSGSYQSSPEGESGSGFHHFLSPGPGPDFNHRVRVRVWILSSFHSGSGFYHACPGPRSCPDSTNTQNRSG